MITKTYKSETMIEALQMAQTELGADAIVVSMREISMGPSWNPWKKVGVEIVAASQGEVSQAQSRKPAPNADVSHAAILQPAANKSGVEFKEEMPEIEWVTTPEKKSAKLPPKIKLNLQSTSAKPSPTLTVETPAEVIVPAPVGHKVIHPALKKIQQQLTQQGVDSTLVDGLLEIALETLSPATLADMDACKKSIIQLMGAGLRVQKGVGTYISSNMVCVVGASGSGKTSVIAKLALYFSQALQKTVTWVCADTVRMGAVAEARAITDALGLKLMLVYVPADLTDILSSAQDSDLFLVDTPRYNPCNESQMVELGALLSEMPKRCTYLVAPATTKEADLFDASAALSVFNVDGLIITKLDETRTFGNVYNFARKNQIPLSFLTNGKEAANHLEVADPARLVEALFGKDWNM